MSQPPLLTGWAPTTHRIWVSLIQSERFGKESEWYIGDPACGPVLYWQCCCLKYFGGDDGICCYMMTYFAIPCCCCHMFGPNSVACCFSALFVILAGFAAVATVCDPTWRSVDQTLSMCLTGCCRWPVALCLLRFEENCVNNLSARSIKIHICSTISTSNWHISVHIQISHGSCLIYNTYTLTPTYLL